MKKIILLISLIGAAYASEVYPEECCCCEPNVHSSYGYFSAGLGPLPIPGLNIGVGKRVIAGESTAVDLGIEGSTFIIVSTVKGYANHLWYFNQRPCSQWYFGLGGSLGGIFPIEYCDQICEGFAAPNFIFGREFLTRTGSKSFVQVETMYPVFLFHDILNYPAVTIKCGFAF